MWRQIKIIPINVIVYIGQAHHGRVRKLLLCTASRGAVLSRWSRINGKWIASMSENSNTTVNDPILRESIAKRLALRNMCSVKVTNLPKRYSYSDLLEIAPDMAACRVYYDPISRKPKNHVYMEFASNEIALKCVNKINNSTFQTKTLSASLGGDLSESVGMLFHVACILR